MSTLLEPARTTTAAYDFGDVSIVFESDDRCWLELLDRRYRPFRRAETPASAFRLRFEPEGALPEELLSPLEAHLEAVEIESQPFGFRLRTRTSASEVRLAEGRGWLRGPSAMYPLDNLLVQLLPLLAESSLLFHAAALSIGDRGVLAAGRSGAGKSTLAALAGRDGLCDEIAAVRFGARELLLVSLPFWVSRPARAPLAAVVVLAHAERHALKRLGPGEALRRLAQLALWPTASAASMELGLGRLARLAETVPVYELAFAPRPDVLSFLGKELS